MENHDVPFGNGTYEVGTGEDQIRPGTYHTLDSVDDCYWERTTEGGDIIDNNFATHAKTITVTVRSSDDSFTSDNCGTWDRVR